MPKSVDLNAFAFQLAEVGHFERLTSVAPSGPLPTIAVPSAFIS